MFDTVAISELQKSPRKTLDNTHGLKFILANNQKQGGIIDKEFLLFIESEDILDQFEDWKLAHDPEILKNSKEIKEKLEKDDLSEFISFDEL